MARQVEKIEMRMRPQSTHDYREGDSFTCEACGEDVPAGDGYVVINKLSYHMKTECVPDTARALYADLRTELLDNLEGSTDTVGMRTLAKQLEPHYRGGPRLDANQIRSLITEEVAKRPPMEIVVRNKGHESITPLAGQHKMFETMMKRLSIGHSCWLTGPAGTGKTTAAVNAAKALGINYYIQTPVKMPYDLFGYQDANGEYHPTALYLWANDPGSLLILDEVDSFAADALVAAHPAMENGILMFPGGRVVEIPDENNIIATANTNGFGATADYGARNGLDGATCDRFRAFLQWEIDEEFELELVKSRMTPLGETLAEHWHRSCLAIRDTLKDKGIKLIWSPRQTMGVIENLVAGCTVFSSGDPNDPHLFEGNIANWRELVETTLRDSALARLPKDQFEKVVKLISFTRPSEFKETVPAWIEVNGSPQTTSEAGPF